MKRFFWGILLLLFILPVTGQAVSRQELARLSKHQGPYNLIVIGDNRSGDKIYKKIIDQLMLRNPDLVVNTGDVIVHPGNRDQWANFWKLSKEINTPYFLVIGNHDIDDKKSEAVWKEEVTLPGNELYYSWTVGQSLFVVLNSCEVRNDKKITGAQLAWLKKTLNPQKYKYQFVFLHHPLYLRKGATHYGKSLDEYPELRDELQKLFVEKKVDMVFAGHEHAYFRRKVDDIWHVITGGGGAPLYGGTFSHFVWVRVDDDRLEVKVIDKKGVVRDHFFVH